MPCRCFYDALCGIEREQDQLGAGKERLGLAERLHTQISEAFQAVQLSYKK
jgi:hypothetical protein